MPTRSGIVDTRMGKQRSIAVPTGSMQDSGAGEVRLERRARVLCAIDARSRSDAALKRAHAIARGVGGKMLLLHVVEKARSKRAARHGEARACFMLDCYARKLVRDGQDAQISIRSGRAQETMAAVAREWDADLIVLGPYRERFGDSFAGTTAERIAHKAERPVLTVNQVSAEPYQHVLLTSDLSPMFVGVAHVVKQLGMLDGSRASVVHSLEYPHGTMLYLAGVTESELGKFQRTRSEIASSEIAMQLNRAELGFMGLSIFPSQAPPLRAIEQVSRNLGADLVVVGSSRFPQLKRWFAGSVSNDVLRGLRNDVLVVPPAAALRARKRARRRVTLGSSELKQAALDFSLMEEPQGPSLH